MSSSTASTQDAASTTAAKPSSPKTTSDADKAEVSLTAPSSTNQAEMTNQLVHVFYQYSKQFLEALCEVWPECGQLRSKKLEFEMACVHGPEGLCKENRKKLILTYYSEMSPHFARCTSKDETLMQDQEVQDSIPFLKPIRFYTKWTVDLHEETKQNVWEYLNNMNRYSNLYHLYAQVPSTMLGKIENMATNIASQLEQGQMDLKDINLHQLGQNVMQGLDEGELQQFAQNMSSNMNDMNGLCGMLGSMLGNQGAGGIPGIPPGMFPGGMS